MGIIDFDLYDSLSNENAGDFVLVHRKLRTYFVVECKWTQSLDVVKEGIDQLLKYEATEKTARVERVLLTNYKVGRKLVEKAGGSGVRVVWLGDGFSDCYPQV